MNDLYLYLLESQYNFQKEILYLFLFYLFIILLFLLIFIVFDMINDLKKGKD